LHLFLSTLLLTYIVKFLYFFLNFAKIQRKNFDHFWVWNFPSRSRASRNGFYPAAAAVKKVAAKPQSQPPGKNSTASETLFGQFSSAEPTGPVSSESRKNRAESLLTLFGAPGNQTFSPAVFLPHKSNKK
jgi:hypothetical protein